MERQMILMRLSMVVLLAGIVICGSAHPQTPNLQVTQQTKASQGWHLIAHDVDDNQTAFPMVNVGCLVVIEDGLEVIAE